jgi:hypothetical protein
MDFKRLNNMTGKDPVLNRRITSIFINDYENFLQVFTQLPFTEDLNDLKFLIHKNSPSFMIFELESLLSRYNYFFEKKNKGEVLKIYDNDFLLLLEDTKTKIQQLKDFLAQLN